MNFQGKKQKGFTLMEVLVYLAVLAIIIASVSSFLVWAIKSNTKARAMREVLDNARRVMEIMVYETRGASSIYTPTSTSTQLSLQTTRYLPPGDEVGYIDFYLCQETTLCFKKDSENPIALTSDSVEVDNLEFIQIATSSVQINLGIIFKNPQNRPEYEASIDLSSTVSIRAPN